MLNFILNFEIFHLYTFQYEDSEVEMPHSKTS